MFEKEAEEYANKNVPIDTFGFRSLDDVHYDVKQAFLAGLKAGKDMAEADLAKAKELIEELSSSLSVVGECDEEECELLNRAEQFIKE